MWAPPFGDLTVEKKKWILRHWDFPPRNLMLEEKKKVWSLVPAREGLVSRKEILRSSDNTQTVQDRLGPRQ